MPDCEALGPHCGDAKIDGGFEGCDDGARQPDLGEECDAGENNGQPGSTCNEECKVEVQRADPAQDLRAGPGKRRTFTWSPGPLSKSRENGVARFLLRTKVCDRFTCWVRCYSLVQDVAVEAVAPEALADTAASVVSGDIRGAGELAERPAPRAIAC
jgi:hypothetical protein